VSTEESTVAKSYKLSELVAALEEAGHRVTPRTLQNDIRAGRLHAHRRPGGRTWYVERDEFERMVSDRGSRPARTKPNTPRKAYKWTDEDHLRTLRRRYGLAHGEYEALCAANDWRCTVCRKRPHEEFADQHPKSRRLNLDHNHDTGAIRGLLCQRCNKHVAFAGERAELVRRILLYVEGRLTPPAQLDLLKEAG